MTRPSDAAIQVEVVKSHLRQSKDGTTISLVFHPDDNASPLINSRIGTRYQCFFLELSDADVPVVPKRKTDEHLAITTSNLLCKEPAFQEWMVAHSLADEASELSCVQGLYRHLKIASRAEFGHNHVARLKWLQLKSEFESEVAYTTSVPT